MTTTTESLLEQVLALPDEERQEFLTLLQARLPELADDEQLGDEWIDELDRRLADVESGNVPTVKWEAVKERLLAKYSTE
jgi:putative addiction module component (TIGR02574 family)